MATEDEPFTAIMARIGPGFNKAWREFDTAARGAADAPELAEAELRTKSDTFQLNAGKPAQTVYDQEAEARDLSLKGCLRSFAGFGLIVSLGGLYTQWIYTLKGTDEFRFELGNTWPALVFGGGLIGLYAEQALYWLARQARSLWLWWRYNSLFLRWQLRRQTPKRQHVYCCCWRCKHNKRHLTIHYNYCHCLRCQLKRRWTYWKRLERYPLGWKRHTEQT